MEQTISSTPHRMKSERSTFQGCCEHPEAGRGVRLEWLIFRPLSNYFANFVVNYLRITTESKPNSQTSSKTNISGHLAFDKETPQIVQRIPAVPENELIMMRP